MERFTERAGEDFQCNDRECRLSYCDRECDHYQCMINKLAEYEDAEEQGLFVRLPCKIGDVLYQLDKMHQVVLTQKVRGFDVEVVKMAEPTIRIWFETSGSCYGINFGSTVFWSKAEAMKALDKYLGRGST